MLDNRGFQLYIDFNSGAQGVVSTGDINLGNAAIQMAFNRDKQRSECR